MPFRRDFHAKPPSQSHVNAAAALVDRKALRSRLARDRQIAVPIANLHPLIREFRQKLMAEMDLRGIPMYVHNAWRDAAVQQRLFLEGRSKARPGTSAHEYGMAFDYVHVARGWDLSEPEWRVIGQIGKEVARRANLSIEWGGEWQFWDPAHWQLRDWRSLKGWVSP